MSRILPYLFTCNGLASFNLTLTSRLPTKPLQNVVVELNLGEGASGIKCVPSRGTGGLGRGGVGMDKGVVGNSGASWAFDARQRVSFILAHNSFLLLANSVIGIEVGDCQRATLE